MHVQYVLKNDTTIQMVCAFVAQHNFQRHTLLPLSCFVVSTMKNGRGSCSVVPGFHLHNHWHSFVIIASSYWDKICRLKGIIEWSTGVVSKYVVFSPYSRPIAEWKWLSTVLWNFLGLNLATRFLPKVQLHCISLSLPGFPPLWCCRQHQRVKPLQD